MNTNGETGEQLKTVLLSPSLLFGLINYLSFINMQLERATVTNRNTGSLEFADYRISKRYRKSKLKDLVNNYICYGVAERLCGLLSRSTYVPKIWSLVGGGGVTSI